MMIAMRLAHQDPKKAIALIEQVPGEQPPRRWHRWTWTVP